MRYSRLSMRGSKRQVFIIGLVGLLALIVLARRVVVATHTNSRVKAPDLGWTDVEAGTALSEREGRPVMLEVYMEGDPDCRVMDRLVYSDWTVASLVRQKFIPVRLNAASHAMRRVRGRYVSETDLARELGIVQYPTTLFLTPTGDVIRSEPGARDVVDFRTILRTVAVSK
jgi:thioredoxin-related protein